ncbi:MAG: NAD-dependent epimerase/dehydratase family protein [Deltaproteobacteria bacterium]|nr:NAD-dependent epimerase/dehydratase family protein [Deltaproteobacteria bacterium]
MGYPVLITGATGFIGGNLVRLLLKQGFKVRALVRSSSDLANLKNLDVELAYGDLRDPTSLIKACDGCEQLYHVAASYQFWSPNPKEFYESNVDGTRNILEAAKAAKISKIVYTSTVGAIQYPHDPSKPSDETCWPTQKDLHNDYKKSKFMAEQVALQYAENGLPVVIVNPSAPIGPYDVKPTPTGKIIVDFLNGRVPAYLDTGLNIIDVEDCAWGHILAAQKGRAGERYILGNKNISLKAIYELIASLTKRKPPKMRIPYAVAWGAAVGSETIGKLFKRRPKVSLGAVRMAKHHMYFSPAKAVKELGLPQSPIENAFARAIEWFENNGYL